MSRKLYINNNMKSESKYLQGKFRPRNPEKYRGNVNGIFFRSSWELHLLKWLDTNENILEYSSEETIIPYFFPVDQKFHRYYVDFLIKVKQTDGKIKEFLIEVKPWIQTQPPKVPKRV